jgi:hypothetical protein
VIACSLQCKSNLVEVDTHALLLEIRRPSVPSVEVESMLPDDGLPVIQVSIEGVLNGPTSAPTSRRHTKRQSQSGCPIVLVNKGAVLGIAFSGNVHIGRLKLESRRIVTVNHMLTRLAWVT